MSWRVFAAAFATGSTWQTFLVGTAASVGAGISMGLAVGLSDDGKLTGRVIPPILDKSSKLATLMEVSSARATPNPPSIFP